MKNKEIKILLAAPRGFCAGVDRAIEIVKKSIEKYGAPVYVRHEIVHNKHVVESLNNGLLVFIKKATPLTILTSVFCLVGLYFLNINYNFDSAILKLIFIGLASLTFPHILLEYLIEKNEK